MVREEKASIFEVNANILVNPVNCQGTMGKGLARQFAIKFPKIVPIYKNACQKDNLKPGAAYTIDLVACQVKEDDSKVDHIVLFTTKGDWRNASRLCWIQSGLSMLQARCYDYFKNDDVIALPKLGAGLGGLNEESVIKLIKETLESVPQEVILCV